MKRTCLLLLLLLSIAYLKEGYKLVTDNKIPESFNNGVLSDIAQEVIAIPLETNNRCILSHAKQIKREGNHLFLLSKHQLFHFTCAGKFVNQITYQDTAHKNHMAVCDYVVDPVNEQLIILDENQNVHYYGYDGRLIARIALPEHHPWQQLLKLSYYDKHIWATANQLTKQNESSEYYLEQWLYKFDTTFYPLEARKLTPADLGRSQICYLFNPEMVVANREVYVHAPSLEPEQLLQDTLYLLSRNAFHIHENNTSILPVRISNRFLISTYYNPVELQKSYTFCFDQKENKSYTVQEGFEDNFYHTGRISELQALDVSNTSYCYYKTGEEVKKAFPERKESDNPVVFIVKLKA